MKLFIGMVAVFLSVFAHGWYIRDIFRGKTRPHIYSWFVWAILTGVVCISQFAHGAKWGAWSTATATLISAYITILALRYGTLNITRSDTLLTLTALSILPFWFITESALGAVLVATTVDAIAFLPTIRKSLSHPQEETLMAYAIHAVRHGLAILAIGNLVFVNYIYPAALVAMNASVAISVAIGRRRTRSGGRISGA